MNEIECDLCTICANARFSRDKATGEAVWGCNDIAIKDVEKCPGFVPKTGVKW